MILEMILMGIFTPPYADYTMTGHMLEGTYIYSIDSIISIINSFRLIQIVKPCYSYSFWTSQVVHKESKKLQFRTSFSFFPKSELTMRPFYLILTMISLIVLISGYSVHMLEKDYVSATKSMLNFGHLTNGFWLSIVTLATVGYGDGYPSTHFGRGTMICTSILGSVLMALYIMALNSYFSMNNQEKTAYSKIIQSKSNLNLRGLASNSIKAAFQMKKIIKSESGANFYKEWLLATMSLKRSLTKMEKININPFGNSKDALIFIEGKISQEIEQIKLKVFDTDYVGKRMYELIKTQKHLNQQVDQIIKDVDFIEKEVEKIGIKKLIA